MVKIEWSSIAENDLNEIIDYIAQDSLEYAISFYDEIRDRVKNLEEFPNLGKKVALFDDPEVRELILRNYRIIYRVFQDKIQIVRVIHGSRMLDFEI